MIAKENNSNAPLIDFVLQVDESLPAVKLNTVLSELKVAELEVLELDSRCDERLVSELVDAFAGSQFDVSRTHLFPYRIYTHNALPFNKSGRPPPFAWLSFLDQDLDRLLALGHSSEAYPGVCSYASRCFVVRKKDGYFRLSRSLQTAKCAEGKRRLSESAN